MDFVHHHVHSEFSALDGMPSAVEVTDRVVALGQRGFSTTDHGMMSGIPSMYREAKARDLLYSPGIEAYFAFDRTLKGPDSFNQKYYHLIFIAHNFEGYQNLSRMQRFAWEEGFYHKARVDMELIERFAGGFSVTTACLGSPVNQAFLRGDVEGAEKFTSDLVDILGKDNVYVELQDHGIPEDEIVIPRNLEMANRLGLKLLATNDSHYCSPEDAHDHEYLLCASTRSHINDPKRFKLETDQFYMKTGEEMAELFPPADFPGAISNTIELAERSEFELPIGDKMTYLMPKFHIPDEYADEADMLSKLAYEGARDPARYGDGNGNISEAAKELIEYELSVIIGMNFPGYLLVVKRIIDLMRENDIGVGAGRGSAPSSALAYCLGITSLDPIKNNLLFWRFLNPDRISMPDIDIDIEKERRPEALKLLQKEFGADNVAQLANFNRMQTAAALERAVKASDFPPSMADLFKSKIAVFLENHDVSLKDALEASRNQKTPLGVAFASEVADDAFSAMFTRAGSSQKRECSIELILSIAARFENKLMGYGVHACGLIITPGPVTDYFPVKTGKDLNVCQFDGSDAESMGAVKMDLLGIQSIDSCQKTERNIALDLGEKIDTSTLSPDDPKVYETLSSGDGKGVFQMGCLAGDVEIDGIAISALYAAQQNGLPVDELNSVCVNTGSVIRNQLKRVVHSGRKPCRSFLVANGSRITATDDHKFFTVDGWRRGGDLVVGDVVLTVTDRGRRVYSAPRKRSKKLIASLISELTGTQWVPTSQKVNLKGSTAELTATTRDGSSAVIVYRGDASAWAHIAGRYENVEVISELDLFEFAATLSGGVKYLALPDDASWQPIVTVDDAGVKDTFDVMMAAPANNVIANGYVVHNSGGMRKLMKKVRPDRFEDLSALLALYRPGPLGMGTPNEFARRKNSGETEFDVIHEDAREILADSYGLCVVGRTMIWDAAAGKPVRIDSIGDRVEDGFYTIGIDDFGEPEVVRVNEWFSLGRRETYKMSVEGGLELIGTADHPVLTGSGWKRMADITGQDVVAIPAGSGPAGMVGLQSDVATANGYDGRLDYGLAEPYQGMTPQEASRYEKVYWSKVNYCVKPGALEEVYDISLDSASHNFIANGIVVSNCIYQEHIMQIATKFAGYTGGEADNLRKAMGKKIKSMMDAHQEKFTVAVDERYPDPVTYRNGDGKEVTESLGHAWWNIMEPFSSYAFNLCLHHATKIRLADGRSMTIAKLHKEFESGKTIELMSMWGDGTIRPHRVKKVVHTGNKPMFKVTTESGRVVTATAEHRFMTTRGYISLSELVSGEDELIVEDRLKHPVTDKQRAARSQNMKKVNIRPERAEQDRRAAERFKDYQATLTFEDRSRHQQEVERKTGRGQRAIKYAQEGWKRAWENDPSFRDRVLAGLERHSNNQVGAGSGFGERSQASNGQWCHSRNERAMAEFLIENDIDFTMHKRVGRGWCDFYFDGMYWEMDGMDRHVSYFERKYGDIPFVVVTPEDYREVISQYVKTNHVTNGDCIVSIDFVNPQDGSRGHTSYDIEMESDGPKNFLLTNGIVSHNSHSAAYAVLSYRTAYLKTYYPAQFGAASIDVDLNGSDKDKKGIDAHIEWMRNRGVTVYSPDINYSVNRGITTKDTVTLPLNIVKGFGEKRVKAIVEEREANGKFESVVDAIARVRLNKGEIISLGLAGAFESFGANRFAVVSRVDDLLQEANLRKTELSFTDSMFDLGEIEQSAGDAVDLLSQPAVVTVGEEEIHTDTASLRDIEKSILGLSVQPHPFSVYGTGLAQAAEAYGKNVFAADELAEDTTLADDEPVVIYGIAVQPEQKLSKKGNLYLRMTVETTEGDADVFVFPPKKEAPPEVSDGDPVIVIGSVKSGYREDDDRKVFGKKVVLPDRAGIKLADSSPFGIFEAKVLQGFPHAFAVPNLPASGEVVSYGVVTEVTNTPKGAVFTLTSGEESVRVMRRGGTIDEGEDLFAVVVGNMAEVNGKRIIDASKALLKKG